MQCLRTKQIKLILSKHILIEFGNTQCKKSFSKFYENPSNIWKLLKKYMWHTRMILQMCERMHEYTPCTSVHVYIHVLWINEQFCPLDRREQECTQAEEENSITEVSSHTLCYSFGFYKQCTCAEIQK